MFFSALCGLHIYFSELSGLGVSVDKWVWISISIYWVGLGVSVNWVPIKFCDFRHFKGAGGFGC